jgi:cytochrome b561
MTGYDNQYSRVAIILHWAIAAFILFNLAVGYVMESLPVPLRFVVFFLHVSSGMTVLALTVIRVMWRLTHEPPPYPARMKPWERHLAHAVHLFLYVAMVLMPLTGWAIVSAHPPAGSAGAAAAALRLPPPPTDKPPVSPNLPAAPPPGAGLKVWAIFPLPPIRPIERIGDTPGGARAQKILHEEFVAWHGLGGFILVALLLLHIAGALKHQLIDREPELARMGISRHGRAGAK